MRYMKSIVKFGVVPVVVAVIAMVSLTSCTHVYSYSTLVYNAPNHFALDAQSSLVPSINPNAPEACKTVASDVSGRADFCRLVWGWGNDSRRWVIQFFDNGIPGGGPSVGNYDPGYGYTITVEDGATYEGCDWISPSNTYYCDYRTTNQFVASTNGCGMCLSFILDKFWNWSHYELGSDIGCAAGGAALLAGTSKVTLPFLLACTDKPWSG